MKISIFWFRRDLRLVDNVGLYHALNNTHPTLPLFIFDTNILNNLEDKADARVEFIYNQVISIKEQLEKKDGSLLIEHGKPEDVFKKLLKKYSVHSVYTNQDYEPYALNRDSIIQKLLHQNKIEFHQYKDQVIFEKSEIVTDTGHPYKVYTPYKNKWKSHFKENLTKPYTSEKLNNYFKTSPFPTPRLSDIGFKKTEVKFPSSKFNLSIIKTYEKTRDYPYLEKGTTNLGIHFRFGTISIREAVSIAYNYNETWLNELIWREFFMQLLFHFPQVVDQSFHKKFDRLKWRYSEKDFKLWCDGKTGYPLVDAGMRQLNSTGTMHNRVRMVCASFLTKHLLIDWRLGEKYFADKLLDYDLSANNGNWQWSAGSGADAQPFFRIFNPALQQKKFDPEFKYIKSWVPEYDTDKYSKPMVEHKFAVERAKKAFNEIK